MAIALKQTRQDAQSRLTELARKELDKAKGDTTKAITGLMNILLEDRPLLRELIAPVVLSASRYAITQANKHERGALFRQASQRGGIVALAQGVAGALLDFRLPGGLQLREAKRSDIIEGSDFYAKQGSDMIRKSSWLRAIAQCVPDDKCAGDVLTDERAVELWETACHD